MCRFTSAGAGDIRAIATQAIARINQQNFVGICRAPLLLIMQDRGLLIEGHNIGIRRLIFQDFAGSQVGHVDVVFTASRQKRFASSIMTDQCQPIRLCQLFDFKSALESTVVVEEMQ